MKSLYLSKRNLLTLLSKIERFENGQETACSLIKYRNDKGQYVQTDDAVLVIAVPDSLYYSSQERAPGEVHPLDNPNREFIEP